MERKDVIENGKLIASFMEFPTPRIKGQITNGLAITLGYHNRWNALMPVVHKCLAYCHEKMLNEWENSFADKFMACSIDSLYNETVEFIKWYNKQN